MKCSLHISNFLEEISSLSHSVVFLCFYTWTSPDGQHRNQIDIFFAAKDGEALHSQQKQDRELTGSDHELLIAKFRLEESGETH